MDQFQICQYYPMKIMSWNSWVSSRHGFHSQANYYATNFDLDVFCMIVKTKIFIP